LLLADYLTQSYALGGVVSVLALESLFQLITQHNLDSPHYFTSLYQLCTLSVFNAKYRAKFMRLLHLSLRSGNLPAYLVSAFSKRLATLALHLSAPALPFCLLQITWLLKHHQQILCLLHRDVAVQSACSVLDDLEQVHALGSSLWELEALEQHALYDLAKRAASLRDPQSTGALSAAVTVLDAGVLEQGYAALLEEALNKKKKLNVAMAYRAPTQLCPPSSLVGKIFK
jgi:U3 small nucleolar RNA-associated protein 19